VAVEEKAAKRNRKKKKKEDKSPAGQLVEFVVIIAVALGLAILIQAVLVKPFRIPSPSMVPTLEVGQRVLVNRLGTHFGDPSRGDVVVFKPPAGADSHQCGIPSQPADGHPCSKPTANKSESNFIKRVVGVPGDTLAVENNRVLINGKPIKEPYIQPGTSCDELCNLQKPIKVPPGHFFMMGDNRGESDDSRDWGPVPKKWIIGRAFFTYWPPGRIGTL
jgi:signal peptidase I